MFVLAAMPAVPLEAYSSKGTTSTLVPGAAVTVKALLAENGPSVPAPLLNQGVVRLEVSVKIMAARAVSYIDRSTKASTARPARHVNRRKMCDLFFWSFSDSFTVSNLRFIAYLNRVKK